MSVDDILELFNNIKHYGKRLNIFEEQSEDGYVTEIIWLYDNEVYSSTQVNGELEQLYKSFKFNEVSYIDNKIIAKNVEYWLPVGIKISDERKF